MNTKNILAIGILAFFLLMVGCSEQITNEQTVKHEPTEEEWQASFKQIALNEVSAYLELSAIQTLSDERLNYAVQTLRTQVANINGSDKTDFEALANFVELNNYESAKEQYLLLGGNKTIFHD